MKGRHTETDPAQTFHRWQQLNAYLEEQAPQTADEIAAAVQGLADWDKPVWVAAAIGAVATAYTLGRPIRSRVTRAVEAAEQ